MDINPDFFVCFFVNPASDIAAEVAGYADVANRIMDLAVFGAAQNRSYRRLASFTDTIGNRVSGSTNLEMAIKYMSNAVTQDGLDVRLGELAFLSVALDAECERCAVRINCRHRFYKSLLAATLPLLSEALLLLLHFFLQSQ